MQPNRENIMGNGKTKDLMTIIDNRLEHDPRFKKIRQSRHWWQYRQLSNSRVKRAIPLPSAKTVMTLEITDEDIKSSVGPCVTWVVVLFILRFIYK